jgi:2-oxoglutarate dehydrogenase E1 component
VESLIQQFLKSSQLSGGNAAFIEELYEQFLLDPMSVPSQWKIYFEGFQGQGDMPHSAIIQSIQEQAKNAKYANIGSGDEELARKQTAIGKLVTAFRSRGHLNAKLDPLTITPPTASPDLDIAYHGLSQTDLQQEFPVATYFGPSKLKLADLLQGLQNTYSSQIGAEFMHISDTEQRQWIQRRLESVQSNLNATPEQSKRILERVTAAEGLERYLHTKYVGQKRFSLEGGESLIPLMDHLIQHGGSNGVKDAIIGMAHRGRLNVLVNTLGKPPQKLFAEFEGRFDHVDSPEHSGDVKYHMGFSADVNTPGGSVHLALAFNPSHLEIVAPVVVGSVKARQMRRQDDARSQVLPIIIHGDAAFAGQGVVMELFQMSQARGFAVGGSVHIVINNQVGFTTSRPDDARSTLYCTDPAKIIGAPVFHVNGDNPEAVVFCAELAFDYRQKFGRDVVIDLVCYRRHGHNEADEPSATQPLMYKNIRSRKTTRELYALELAQKNIVSEQESKALVDSYRDKLDNGDVTTDVAIAKKDAYAVDWTPWLDGKLSQQIKTGLAKFSLESLAKKINTIPENFKLQARVAKIYDDRHKMLAGELPLDWGFAENLAYATLLTEGFRLRLVGQDAGRGTFFHRHAILHEQNSGETHMPLQQFVEKANHAVIIDSLLSEEAVMAFEYGYSTAEPMTLNIWEGQFGDFANGAQVVIDQFITSGESKWHRLCGLVLFLPHGYEGQGPEHSSARLERFLQLCALNNVQVCTPTTPAQMFHMLRRQMLRATRKPLIVMTPKSMLRHKLSVSKMDDLENGQFQELISDSTCASPKQATRVVICAGKVYYDLVEAATEQKLDNVAIVRIEQLYPFPREALRTELARFPNAKDVFWCQEEPQNQGAWYQIQHHLRSSIPETSVLHYAGRARSAAPACGHANTHIEEQNQLIADALVNPGTRDFTHE